MIFKVRVNAYLNKMYDLEVEAEDDVDAYAIAKDEVFGLIDPFDIEVEAESPEPA